MGFMTYSQVKGYVLYTSSFLADHPWFPKNGPSPFSLFRDDRGGGCLFQTILPHHQRVAVYPVMGERFRVGNSLEYNGLDLKGAGCSDPRQPAFSQISDDPSTLWGMWGLAEGSPAHCAKLIRASEFFARQGLLTEHVAQIILLEEIVHEGRIANVYALWKEKKLRECFIPAVIVRLHGVPFRIRDLSVMTLTEKESAIEMACARLRTSRETYFNAVIQRVAATLAQLHNLGAHHRSPHCGNIALDGMLMDGDSFEGKEIDGKEPTPEQMSVAFGTAETAILVLAEALGIAPTDFDAIRSSFRESYNREVRNPALRLPLCAS